MGALGKVIAGGAIAVVVFDVIASIASVRFGFAYATASVGTWTIYALVGLLATRHGDFRSAAVAGGAMGLVDATVGWAVSMRLGAGRVPAGPAEWVTVAITVTLIAASIGGLAGLAARLAGPSSATQRRG